MNQRARADETVSPCDVLVAAMTAAVVRTATVVAAAVSTVVLLVIVLVALDIGVIAEIVVHQGFFCKGKFGIGAKRKIKCESVLSHSEFRCDAKGGVFGLPMALNIRTTAAVAMRIVES